MLDIIGRIDKLEIEKYSVLQVNDGEGKGWLDFSTLREPWELDVAVRMVDNRGGINGFRTADYRIWQNGEAVYVNDTNRIKINNYHFRVGDRLEVHRFDDEEDLAAGWVLCKMIVCAGDAQLAVDRCVKRFRESDDKRHYRVMDAEGKIKLSQNTFNSLRLSGILWQADPLKSRRITEFASDRYDIYAARIMEMATEWDTQVVPILDELKADQKLRDEVYSFIALSI